MSNIWNIGNVLILNLCRLTVSYGVHVLIIFFFSGLRLDHIIFFNLILKWFHILFCIFCTIPAWIFTLISIQYWPITSATFSFSFLFFNLFKGISITVLMNSLKLSISIADFEMTFYWIMSPLEMGLRRHSWVFGFDHLFNLKI